MMRKKLLYGAITIALVLSTIYFLIGTSKSGIRGHIVEVQQEIIGSDEIKIRVLIEDYEKDGWLFADEYRIYVYSADGVPVEKEPDISWKNLDGERTWITLSSDYDPSWDIYSLGSTYTVKLMEEDLGLQDERHMTTPVP